MVKRQDPLAPIREGFKEIQPPEEAGTCLDMIWFAERQIFIGCFTNGVWEFDPYFGEWEQVELPYPAESLVIDTGRLVG